MLYRKIPAIVHAERFVMSSDKNAMAKWCGGRLVTPADIFLTHIIVPTIEGGKRAYLGDWIIHNESTGFQVYQATLFGLLYENVEDGSEDQLSLEL